MNEVKGYRWFVKHFAPLGYAHLYRRTGDFNVAQRALEEVVKAGFETWEKTRADGHPGFGARLMAGMVGRHALEEAPPAAIESSLARSRKLAAVNEAVGVLREFRDDEGIAVFLLYVEEVPEEHVHEWLGVDEPHVEMLRERVRRRAASIEVPVAGAEDAYGFFQRTLRQYRLPATMFDRVQNTVRRREAPNARPAGGHRALITIGAVALLILLLDTWNVDDPFSTRRGPYGRAGSIVAFQVLLDVILSIGAILIGAAMAGSRRESAGVLMVVGGGFGVLMIFIGVLATYARAGSDFVSAFAFVRNLWQLVMLTFVVTGAYQAVRDRGRTERSWAS